MANGFEQVAERVLPERCVVARVVLRELARRGLHLAAECDHRIVRCGQRVARIAVGVDADHGCGEH